MISQQMQYTDQVIRTLVYKKILGHSLQQDLTHLPKQTIFKQWPKITGITYYDLVSLEQQKRMRQMALQLSMR